MVRDDGVGSLPSSSNILSYAYPISRTLFHVTRKNDADCVKTAGACDFVGNPGPAIASGGNDLNVTGGASGVSGAIREFTRWLCRPGTAQQKVDPFTGTNYNSEITTGINTAGFTIIGATWKTSGSRCRVNS